MSKREPLTPQQCYQAALKASEYGMEASFKRCQKLGIPDQYIVGYLFRINLEVYALDAKNNGTTREEFVKACTNYVNNVFDDNENTNH